MGHGSGTGSPTQAVPVAPSGSGGGSLLGSSPPSAAALAVPSAPLPSAERVPSKPQQLLNKLKLGKKPQPPIKTATGSAPGSITSSAGGVQPSGISALLQQQAPPPAPPALTSPRLGSASQQAAPPYGFCINPRGGDSEPDFEELSPHASVPTNPLAPLLTPFRMMKPLVPLVASKATAAAVAGIKKPWQKQRSVGGEVASALAAVEGSLGTDSSPPMGYLWVWMGSFRRWQRRFVVASEAPGLLLMYKRMNMKGKVLSISLRNVDIHEDPSDSRQLKIVTPTGFIFLRSELPEERAAWLECLKSSQALYNANQGLVERLKNQGLLPPPPPKVVPALSVSAAAVAALPGTAAGLVSAIPAVITGLPEAANMDAEQRRRIRARVSERLVELAPFQREVERHVNGLSTQLLAVVSGLKLRLPPLAPGPSLLRLQSLGQPQGSSLGGSAAAGTGRTGGIAGDAPPHRLPTISSSSLLDVHPASIDTALSAGLPPVTTVGRAASGTGAAAAVAPGSPPAAATAPASPLSRVALEAAGSTTPRTGSAPLLSTTDLSGPDTDQTRPGTPSRVRRSADEHATAAAAAGGVADVLDPLALPDPALSLPLIKSHLKPKPGKAESLQQAFSQLMEAVRYGLHAQAVRIAELETENYAYRNAMTLMKHQAAQQELRLRRSATSLSAPGGSGDVGGGAEASRVGADAPRPLAGASSASEDLHVAGGSSCSEDDDEGSGVGGDDAASIMTADEDAFDVTEAFDDGVDYGILDRPDDEDEEGGAEARGSPAAPPPSEQAASVRRRASTGPPGLTGTPAGSDQVTDRSSSRSLRQLGRSSTKTAGQGGKKIDPLEEHQAQVLSALEVVRQVEYVEQQGSRQLKQVLSTVEPSGRVPQPREGTTTDAVDEDDDVEEEEGDDGEGASHGRTALPSLKPLGKGFSIWSLLKNMIGKDLTRLTMPATINEPTSTLQRLAEGLEYREMLDRAAAEPVSIDRLMIITVWNAATYASQPLRDAKPFNPLLGETYEWQSWEGDTRYVCEQVSHHPPVLAYIADSTKAGWQLQGELETKSKFWGTSAEVVLTGVEGLRIPKWGDELRWNRATICVQDIILGNYWIDVYGKVRVQNMATGETATLNLKPCRKRQADRGKLEGSVVDAQGHVVWELSGSTADRIYAQLTAEAAAARGLPSRPPPQLIWERPPYPPGAAEQYWFSLFTVRLNDPGDRIVPYLPPTDTRFRPDQRALEVGEWNRATSEKLRLEEKQRQARRERARLGITYQPAWFKHVDAGALVHMPEQPGFAWEFTGDYWERRAARNWDGCLDLYSHSAQSVVPKVGAQPPSP